MLQKPAVTRGDVEGKAAGDSDSLFDVVEIKVSAPEGWRADVGNSTNLKLTTEASTLEPLEDPSRAYQIYRLAPYLESIIQAIVVNAYSPPFTFRPMVDCDEKEDREAVRAAMAYEKAKGDLEKDVDVSDEELEEEIERLRRRIEREMLLCEAWFSQACLDMSYDYLRKLTGQDKHIIGTAYWEVVRDTENKPKYLSWAPAWSIRARVTGSDYLGVSSTVRTTKVTWKEEVRPRRFKSYAQLDSSNQVRVYFKEFGDPRVMSRGSGKYYDSLEDMQKAESFEVYDENGDRHIEKPQPATELIDFKIPYAGVSAYGKPRWTPNWPDMVGMRDLAEENRLVVIDQSIPNLLIMVAGPRVDNSEIAALERKLKERQPGQKRILVVRAFQQARGSTSPGSTPQFHIERLRDVQHTDGLGLNYHKQGYANLRATYKVPRVCLGDDEGINRSAAFGMFRFVEDQVWDPERDEFDDRLNTTLLPSLGVMLVKYKTLSRAPRDPELLANIVSTLARAGVLTPEEGHEISEEIFSRPFKDLDGAWSRLPMTILNAVLQTRNQLTAAAIIGADDKVAGPEFLSRLGETLLQEFQRAGLGLNVQGRRSSDGEDGEDGEGEEGRPGGIPPGGDGRDEPGEPGGAVPL